MNAAAENIHFKVRKPICVISTFSSPVVGHSPCFTSLSHGGSFGAPEILLAKGCCCHRGEGGRRCRWRRRPRRSRSSACSPSSSPPLCLNQTQNWSPDSCFLCILPLSSHLLNLLLKYHEEQRLEKHHLWFLRLEELEEELEEELVEELEEEQPSPARWTLQLLWKPGQHWHLARPRLDNIYERPTEHIIGCANLGWANTRCVVSAISWNVNIGDVCFDKYSTMPGISYYMLDIRFGGSRNEILTLYITSKLPS